MSELYEFLPYWSLSKLYEEVLLLGINAQKTRKMRTGARRAMRAGWKRLMLTSSFTKNNLPTSARVISSVLVTIFWYNVQNRR